MRNTAIATRMRDVGFMRSPCAPRVRGLRKYVEDEEQADPDEVDEVPIDRARRQRVMPLHGQLTRSRLHEHQHQEDHAAYDVSHMYGRHDVEEARVDTVVDAEAHVRVVHRLQCEEPYPQKDRQAQAD